MVEAPGDAALTLWLCMPEQAAVDCIARGGVVVRDHGGPKRLLGLREQPEDAVERARLLGEGHVSKDSHLLLRIVSTHAGVAHYTVANAGAEHCYAPMPAKRVYSYGKTDWGVWYFHGDLPLHACLTDEENTTLLRVEGPFKIL